MGRGSHYAIELTREADEHLAALGAPDRALVLDSLESRLGHEPNVETRNRKRLRPNPVAPWELRIGRLRVYFEIEYDPRPLVRILAVGVKEGSRLRIGGEEVELQ